MILVDSNLWVYYFDATLPEHESVVPYMEKIFRDEKIAITTVVALETLHYIFQRLGTAVGNTKGKIFLRFPFIVIDLLTEDLSEILERLSLSTHLGIGGRDASILAAMQRIGINTIATHDQAFKRLADINVIDPIE